MRYHADLHIHSKYSRATSRDLDLEHLAYWARKKGITVVGTGDFTHPVWLAELKEKLRLWRGRVREMTPSRYLADIEAELIEHSRRTAVPKKKTNLQMELF